MNVIQLHEMLFCDTPVLGTIIGGINYYRFIDVISVLGYKDCKKAKQTLSRRYAKVRITAEWFSNGIKWVRPVAMISENTTMRILNDALIHIYRGKGQIGVVYVVEFNNGCVKIGKSLNPTNRIASLTRDSHMFGVERLRVHPSAPTMYYSKLEKMAHKELSSYRYQNTEMFTMPFEDAVSKLNTIENELSLRVKNTIDSNIEDTKTKDGYIILEEMPGSHAYGKRIEYAYRKGLNEGS